MGYSIRKVKPGCGRKLQKEVNPNDIKRLSLVLTGEDYLKLKEVANSNSVTMSEIARELISEYLESIQ